MRPKYRLRKAAARQEPVNGSRSTESRREAASVQTTANGKRIDPPQVGVLAPHYVPPQPPALESETGAGNSALQPEHDINAIAFASLLNTAGGDASVADPPDGSLLFCQNSKRVVEQFTHSDITHVAIVMHEDGECMVYEAAPPKVRRVHITRFYKEIGLKNRGKDSEDEVKVWMLPPNDEYANEDVAKMRSYLESQLGRRYSLRSWIREQPSDGVHCAELTADAIAETGRLTIHDGHTEDPSTLLPQLASEYGQAHEVLISIDEDDEELKKSWRQRATEKWASFREWCAWTCSETWKFCR